MQATDAVRLAEPILTRRDAAAHDPTRTAITDARKLYERDILPDVTWHP